MPAGMLSLLCHFVLFVTPNTYPRAGVYPSWVYIAQYLFQGSLRRFRYIVHRPKRSCRATTTGTAPLKKRPQGLTTSRVCNEAELQMIKPGNAGYSAVEGMNS